MSCLHRVALPDAGRGVGHDRDRLGESAVWPDTPSTGQTRSGYAVTMRPEVLRESVVAQPQRQK